jgi:hypothetical protein
LFSEGQKWIYLVEELKEMAKYLNPWPEPPGEGASKIQDSKEIKQKYRQRSKTRRQADNFWHHRA